MNGLLPGFEPLAVRRPGDCGPVAMLQLLRYASHHIDYDDLLRVWRFREGADRLDTPGHHLRTLRRLGMISWPSERLGGTTRSSGCGGRAGAARPLVTMRFAFRRGLDRRTIAEALAGRDSGGGRPVALLVPTGAVRWHWIVACGRAPGGAIVSPGDGVPRLVSWEALDRARLRPGRDHKIVRTRRRAKRLWRAGWTRHVASRLLGIEGLGYVVAPADSREPLPFPTDRALERDILQLARAAEEALAVAEPVLVWVESLLQAAKRAKIGWKGTPWSDMLHAG